MIHSKQQFHLVASSIISISCSKYIGLGIKQNENIDIATNFFNQRYITILEPKENIENDPSTTVNENYASMTYNWEDIFGASLVMNNENHVAELVFGMEKRAIYNNEHNVKVTDKGNNEHDCLFLLTIEPVSVSAIELFGSDEPKQTLIENEHCKIHIPMWTRNNCYILSSLADDDKNNFLGHTRTASYTPIKYYRLTNQSKKFWIELYETDDHSIPVTLPNTLKPNPDFDDTQEESDSNKKYLVLPPKDDLFIEAIVCFSSSGML